MKGKQKRISCLVVKSKSRFVLCSCIIPAKLIYKIESTTQHPINCNMYIEYEKGLKKNKAEFLFVFVKLCLHHRVSH